MAVMAKKGKREVPAMSTSSLPDIVFMLLFFFMAATTMREVEDIRDFISATTVTKGVGPNDVVVNLRVDEGATVGKLTAVKQELRKAEALNISYAARAMENK